MSQDTPNDCLNCGYALPSHAKYCPACGQKVLADEDRRLGKLIKDAAAEITDLRGRVLPSFGSLLFYPGYLARNYRLGRRKGYVSPVSLFLFANVIYFLFPVLSDFQIDLVDQISLQPYSVWTEAIISNAMGVESALAAWREGSADFRALADQYSLRAADISKAIIVVHVPFLALVTALLTFDLKVRFVDHVVLALHYMAFIMLWFVVGPKIVIPLIDVLLSPFMDDPPSWRIGFGLTMLYALFMFRIAFDMPWWRAIVTGAIFLLAYGPVHSLFRLVQFLVVFYTL
ncbi:MAG: DUF3667 domain-containing protein [Pseudomonadota bacterium]